jgi:hypothetical protein
MGILDNFEGYFEEYMEDKTDSPESDESNLGREL